MKWYLLLFLWVSTSSAGIFWFGGSALKEFDPSLVLSQHLMSLDFEDNIVESLPHRNRATIFHIVDASCPCTWINNAHRTELNKWAGDNHVANQMLTLSDHPELSQYVPSTPAALVIDEQGQLVYFGPYAQGAGCFQSKGFVDARIKPYFASGHSALPSIVTEARGCYCENLRSNFSPK